MKFGAACRVGQRLDQQDAGQRLAGFNQVNDGFIIFSRLLRCPYRGTSIQGFKAKCVACRGMANNATSVAHTLLQEDRFNRRSVFLIVERLRRCGERKGKKYGGGRHGEDNLSPRAKYFARAEYFAK